MMQMNGVERIYHGSRDVFIQLSDAPCIAADKLQ